MKIYFGASTSQFDRYKEYYFAVRDFLAEEGHVITRDWLQIHRKDLVEHPERLLVHRKGPEAVYKIAMKGFYDAEMMIAENTVPSFSNGHLMTLALQRKIPVLVIQLKNRPKRYLKKSFLEGINEPNLEIVDYDLDNYQDVLRSFLNKYEDYHKKHRFHLVIDEVEKRYLDWANHTYDESKTGIIRDALRQRISDDKKYSK